MDTPPIRFTVEEGQLLLRISAHFALPDKVGDKSYTVAERALAAQDVQKLYLALKAHSPLLQKSRRLCFGPESAWEGTDGENFKVRRNGWDTVDIPPFDEDTLSGAYWCLLISMHPSSPVSLNVSNLTEIALPLARKLRISKKLKKDIGVEGAEHKRLELDPLPGEASSVEEAKE